MSYKTPRLLVEAINREMDALRKRIIGAEPSTWGDVDAQAAAAESVNDLRKLVDELAAMASRPTIDDVRAMSAIDYVTTMKPLVADYHRKLLMTSNLAPCLCEDLQAAGTLLILIGDGRISIVTAHHPDRPEVGLAIEAMIEAMDTNTRKVAEDGVAEAEKMLGIEPVDAEAAADQVPARLRYVDTITSEDNARNMKAEFVVDANGDVIKDRNGPVPRTATQEEIDSCVLVKDPGSGVGFCAGYHDDSPCGADDCFALKKKLDGE